MSQGESAPKTRELSAGDVPNWRDVIRVIDRLGLRDQFTADYTQIDESDKLTLEKFFKGVVSGGDVRECFEACLLEMFDNSASVFLKSVSSIEDKFKYSEILRAWCDEILPTWEFDFRSHFDPTILTEIEQTIGPLEGRISGTVSRAKLAEHMVRWEAKASRRVRTNDAATHREEPLTTLGAMSRPVRSEIEKFANDSSSLAHERLAGEYATKRNQVLAQVRLKHNTGGYAPALIELAALQVRDSILAYADAYTEAFTISGVPADAKAKKSLETASVRIAGGAISGVRGQLDLLKGRTRMHLKIPVGHINREIEKSRVLALKEGKLRLDRQSIEVRSAGKQDSKSAAQSDNDVPRSQSETAGPILPKLSLEAHRKDQERRKNAKRDLREALESYFSTLASGKEVEITKLAEIMGAYACEVYNSSAAGYLAIPFLDPEALFGMAGPLNVGLTLADVEKCFSTLRVRRPWKISSDPVVRLFDDGRELMVLHYEHPWLKQEIGNIVTKRVQDARKEYEEGFQSPPEANSHPAMPANDWDSLRSGFMQIRADCAITPPINSAGLLTAIWTSQPEPGAWRLNYWEAKDGGGFKERFTWHASEAAALLGHQGEEDDALSYWLDQVKLHAPKQYVRRIVTTGGPDNEDQLYSLEILDICGLSAEFCRKCKGDAIRARAKSQENLHPRAEARKRGTEEDLSERQRTVVEHPDRRPNTDKRENTKSASWDTIEISFLSDERVQIRNGTSSETRNYNELGFADRRTGKPNLAWVTLRTMAEQNGIIGNGANLSAAWPKVEKRMQEIRRVLRKHFSIAVDPTPFVERTGYQACFKIGCSSSFRT